MSVRHTIVGSPVGPLTLVGDGAALVGLYYANGWNPISIIAACRRVVGVSGSLTGYAGGRGRTRQAGVSCGRPRNTGRDRVCRLVGSSTFPGV